MGANVRFHLDVLFQTLNALLNLPDGSSQIANHPAQDVEFQQPILHAQASDDDPSDNKED